MELYLQEFLQVVQYYCGWQAADCRRGADTFSADEKDSVRCVKSERAPPGAVKGEGMRRKRAKYKKEYPLAMYRYFRSYSDGGAPSFQKFALSIGVLSEDLESWRVHKAFDRSYRECSEIRRDYLIDNALTRRFDPSLVKFLLSCDTENEGESDTVSVKVEVIE